MTGPTPPMGELLMEVRRLGNALRVAAFDPVRLDEVVVQAPVGTSIESLRRLCWQKLERRRSRQGADQLP